MPIIEPWFAHEWLSWVRPSLTPDSGGAPPPTPRPFEPLGFIPLGAPLPSDSQAPADVPCRCAGCGEPVGHPRHSRSVCWHQACRYPRKDPAVTTAPSHPEAIVIQLDPTPAEGLPQALVLPWQRGPVQEVGRNGAQADEVLRQVVDYLNAFLPPLADGEARDYTSSETGRAVFYIQMAIEALEARTRDREARGVEGTAQA